MTKNGINNFFKKGFQKRLLAITLTLIIALNPIMLFAYESEEQPEQIAINQIEEVHSTNASNSANTALLDEIRRERDFNRGLLGFDGDYALANDSTPVNVIVLFESSPAPVQVIEAQELGIHMSLRQAEAVVESEHDMFRRELGALFSSDPRSRAATPYVISDEFFHALNGAALTLPSDMVESLADFDSVRAVFPDEIITVDPVTVEEVNEAVTLYNQFLEDFNPWGMQQGRAMMQADELHRMGYRGQGVVIAVLDTGIEYAHPAFHGAFMTWDEVQAHNARRGANIQHSDLWHVRYVGATEEGVPFWNNFEPISVNEYLFLGRNMMQGFWTTEGTWTDPNTGIVHEWRDYPANYPAESQRDHLGITAPGVQNNWSNHGTHVAGTIVGRFDGRPNGILGVAPEAKMFAYRSLGVAGPGGNGTGSVRTILRSIEWTAFDRPDVVNMSLGGGSQTTNGLTSIAINNIMLADPFITFVVSAGNAGNNGFYTVTDPAPATLAITVANLTAPTTGVTGFTGVTVRYETGEAPVNVNAAIFYSPMGTTWTLEGGLVRSSFYRLPESGEYRVFVMPRTASNDSLDFPGLATDPGAGTSDDFEALIEKYGSEALQGAWVLVRRGHTFVDVAALAFQNGLGGLIGVNNPGQGNVAAHTQQLGVVPWIYFNNNAAGMALRNAIAVSDKDYLDFTLVGLQGNANPTVSGIAAGSSRGPIFNSYEISPDVGAHGTTVWSASRRNDSGYANMSGTSMAAPHVSGAAALLINYSRDNGGVWDNQEIKARLMNTANQMPLQGTHGNNNRRGSVFDQGSGSINVYRAALTNTVVTVAYNRVVTSPIALNVDMGSLTDDDYDFKTANTGSFSFGGVNRYFFDRDVSRTLTASISNNSDTEVTYRITFAWNNIVTATHGGTQDAGANGVTLSFSQNPVRVPEGGTVSFDATMHIPEFAADGKYEGFIYITKSTGERVATMPFAGVVATNRPNFDNIHIYRPVISTGDFAQSEASRELGILFTPRRGLALRSWVYNAAALERGLTGDNWTDERFDDYFLGFAGTFELPIAGAAQHYTVNQVHRAVIFNGKFLDLESIPPEQRIVHSGVLNDPYFPNAGRDGAPGPLNFVTQNEGTWIDLDEGDFVLVIEVHESQFINDWVWNYDIILPFAVDNTPPELSNLTVANGVPLDKIEDNTVVVRPEDDFVITGNVFDEWVSNASGSVTFDIWREGSQNREVSLQNNLAVFIQVGEEPAVRIEIAESGDFEHAVDLSQQGMNLPLDINIFALDNFSIIPRFDKLTRDFPPLPMSRPNVQWPMRELAASNTFDIELNGLINADPALNSQLHIAQRFVAQPAGNAAIHAQHVWAGLNMINKTITVEDARDEFERAVGLLIALETILGISDALTTVEAIERALEAQLAELFEEYSITLTPVVNQWRLAHGGDGRFFLMDPDRERNANHPLEIEIVPSGLITFADVVAALNATPPPILPVNYRETPEATITTLKAFILGLFDEDAEFAFEVSVLQWTAAAGGNNEFFLMDPDSSTNLNHQIKVYHLLDARAFDNGSFFRIWPADGLRIPFSAEITAIDQDNNNVPITKNQMWEDVLEGNEVYGSFDISKEIPWQTLTFKIQAFGQIWSVDLINDRNYVLAAAAEEFTVTVYDEDWRDSINIRFFLDGVQTAIALSNITLIADGVTVQNITDYTLNIADWQESINALFISKTRQNWQTLTVIATAAGHTITLEYINNMFVPEE